MLTIKKMSISFLLEEIDCVYVLTPKEDLVA